MKQLNKMGYEAYVVGGCVRDSLLGFEPKDWDICTSATPDEVEEVFSHEDTAHIVETGLQHGTVSVIMDHVPYEVTTFRVDGEYTDHRHPDAVRFVRSLREDVGRRDFTVNAMAYHPDTGVIDYFGGQEDLARHVIRAVGDAHQRFSEDALRILRALRFASVYGFHIDEETGKAIRDLYPTLSHVASERIWQEMKKLLCGNGCLSILLTYPEVICEVFPELAPSVGFDQMNPHHIYTVYEHMVRSVALVPPRIELRLAMLVHDAGKPAAFTVDEKGIGHAYGHAMISAQLASQALTRLRVDTRTRDRVLTLVEHHDILFPTTTGGLKRFLHRFGEECVMDLLEVKRADNLAKGTCKSDAIEAYIQSLRETIQAILDEKPALQIRDLAVNGRDLMTLGIPAGPEMGRVLEGLLECVLSDTLRNEREALLRAAQDMVRASQDEGRQEG